MKEVYETAVHRYICNMICHNGYITEESAEYLNSHPAFIDSCGCIMNPDFFDKYVKPEFFRPDCSVLPVLYRYREVICERYREGVCDKERFDLDDAKAFLAWLDPKWTEYRCLDRSEFFKGTDLKFANDGIEFMDI